MPHTLKPTFATVLKTANRPQVGMWVCSGSPLVAEICAGSGLDWLLIDMEHAPNGIESVLAQLLAVGGYPIEPVVRVPVGDTVLIKQVLDLGAQDILVPMVSTAEQAQRIVDAAHYPPRGRRGVGSALARSGRWNRVDGYLEQASEHVGVHVQIENAEGVENAAEIAAVDGIDSIFVGPADLAASMGLLGQQSHPDVIAAVQHTFDVVRAAGKPVGVNTFETQEAHQMLRSGIDYMLVAADVAMLARGSEKLAAEFATRGADPTRRSSY
ncbi:HpcH/HpaI aldolase family protein [Luteococcus sp. Sow4_B9]|uniref:HpcH/HpaI aldolase family protein n=1 Tax=Luteococcus sp. Sow4_B9 TaxID=3438792 RepID=UPI003F974A50